MTNKYRVDRVMSLRVPCGMNSIRYIGDNWRDAQKAYDLTTAGVDTWGQPNTAYGVILSIWDGTDYVIKFSKGVY